MTPTQRGYYFDLLCHAWIGDVPGHLPTDPDIIWRLARASSRSEFESESTLVMAQFKTSRGGKSIYSPRLIQEWTKLKTLRENRKINGQFGASAKWESPRDIQNKNLRSQRLKEARQKGTHTRDEFQEMVNFFEGICVKCGSAEGVVRDHIIPIYQGGDDSIRNLQPLCTKCNSSKGPDRTDYRLLHLMPSKMPGKWLVMPSSSSSTSFATANTKPKTTPAAAPLDLPAWLPEVTWIAFSDMRKKMRAPLTRHASLLIFKKLSAWMEEGHNPQEVLETSIENGWRGIFLPRKENSNGNGRGPLSYDEAIAKSLRNFGFEPDSQVD